MACNTRDGKFAPNRLLLGFHLVPICTTMHKHPTMFIQGGWSSLFPPPPSFTRNELDATSHRQLGGRWERSQKPLSKARKLRHYTPQAPVACSPYAPGASSVPPSESLRRLQTRRGRGGPRSSSGLAGGLAPARRTSRSLASSRRAASSSVCGMPWVRARTNEIEHVRLEAKRARVERQGDEAGWRSWGVAAPSVVGAADVMPTNLTAWCTLV